MTPPENLPQRGQLIPGWTIKDSAGQPHALWDYRQKSHVLLLWEPEASAETRRRWLSAIEADRKQWDWLNVEVLIVAEAPAQMSPGAYAIDRYGILLNMFPASRWKFDDLEKEFLFYEAKHC
jgi:hypothetical protein